jgi:hypothetical protein
MSQFTHHPFIAEMESIANRDFGENGHIQNKWNITDIRETITQFQFQCVRNANIFDLKFRFEEIIIRTLVLHDMYERIEILALLYKLIAHTRDIKNGKGECSISYMMLYVWSNFFPELAKYMLRQFVISDNSEHPFGSWKDLKYFLNYCLCESNNNFEHPMILAGLDLYVLQIRKEKECISNKLGENDHLQLSLCNKWEPRENSSKFGWIHEKIAMLYFPHYIESVKNVPIERQATVMERAIRKAKMDLRKIVSAINRVLDTPQIKQCAKRWSEIDHNKTTSVTIHRQKNAFMNIDKPGNVRSNEPDRIKCAENFKEYVETKIKTGKNIKGGCIGINEFVKQAIACLNKEMYHDFAGNSLEKEIINSQWCDNSTSTNSLPDMIAVCDVSGSMDGDPLYVSIGMGIRVAEKSKLGPRVLTFSETPTWVDLSDCNTFTDKVQRLKSAKWGANTNFYATLNLILDSIVEKKLCPTDVENMILIIFSDMQMNKADDQYTDNLHKNIQRAYHDTGVKLWGVPFKCPHIVFWNLRYTGGFPTFSKSENASMMSGFNPNLLNIFCENGVNALEKITPFLMLEKTLESPRYYRLEEIAREYFTHYF